MKFRVLALSSSNLPATYLFTMHTPTIPFLLTILAYSSTTVTADLILAVAPVSKIIGGGADLLPRHDLSCPEATQTVCPDGNGCCERGAACAYPSGFAVCEKSCGAGPRCSYGGCCDVGYMCNPSRGGNCLVATSTEFDFPSLTIPTFTFEPTAIPTGDSGDGDDGSESESDSFSTVTGSPASSSSVAGSSSFLPCPTSSPERSTSTPSVTSIPGRSSPRPSSSSSESTSPASSSTDAAVSTGAAHLAAPFSDYWTPLVLGWLARILF